MYIPLAGTSGHDHPPGVYPNSKSETLALTVELQVLADDPEGISEFPVELFTVQVPRPTSMTVSGFCFPGRPIRYLSEADSGLRLRTEESLSNW